EWQVERRYSIERLPLPELAQSLAVGTREQRLLRLDERDVVGRLAGGRSAGVKRSKLAEQERECAPVRDDRVGGKRDERSWATAIEPIGAYEWATREIERLGELFH